MRYLAAVKRVSLLVGLGLCVTACAEDTASEEAFDTPPTPSADGDDADDSTFEAFDLAQKADGLNLVQGPLIYEAACEPGPRMTIAAVGDVLLHGRLQKQAWTHEGRFGSLWGGVADLLGQADLTYANLEGPTAAGVSARGRDVTDPGEAFDNFVYTSYPMFNYHPLLVDDLLATGVDIVSTANNHSLDRWSLGVDRTIDALVEKGLPFTGTRRIEEDVDSRPWHTVTKTQGITLAWVACTYATNGIPDHKDQVLFCYEDQDELEALVESLSANPEIDAVIVTPHWGAEYNQNPRNKEVDLAHRLLDLGATAIIGSHPHVLQPWEKHVTPDGRETFVIYSLGNFVSGQTHLPRRSTLILYLGLTKTDAGVKVNGARYVPVHVTRDAAGIHADAIDRTGGFSDSRALTVGMFGNYNLHPPAAALDTTPQCDPEWAPPPEPHAHDGWIGGSCEAADMCGGADCAVDHPGGLCTEICERTCPDRAGRAVTFCVDLGDEDGGRCVARCTEDAECREGYECTATERYKEPQTVRNVCVPKPTE